MCNTQICLEDFFAEALALRNEYELQKLQFYRTKVNVLSQLVAEAMQSGSIPNDFWIKCPTSVTLNHILEPLRKLYNTFHIEIAYSSFKHSNIDGIKYQCFNFLVVK